MVSPTKIVLLLSKNTFHVCNRKALSITYIYTVDTIWHTVRNIAWVVWSMALVLYFIMQSSFDIIKKLMELLRKKIIIVSQLAIHYVLCKQIKGSTGKLCQWKISQGEAWYGHILCRLYPDNYKHNIQTTVLILDCDKMFDTG